MMKVRILRSSVYKFAERPRFQVQVWSRLARVGRKRRAIVHVPYDQESEEVEQKASCYKC